MIVEECPPLNYFNLSNMFCAVNIKYTYDHWSNVKLLYLADWKWIDLCNSFLPC